MVPLLLTSAILSFKSWLMDGVATLNCPDHFSLSLAVDLLAENFDAIFGLRQQCSRRVLLPVPTSWGSVGVQLETLQQCPVRDFNSNIMIR